MESLALCLQHSLAPAHYPRSILTSVLADSSPCPESTLCDRSQASFALRTHAVESGSSMTVKQQLHLSQRARLDRKGNRVVPPVEVPLIATLAHIHSRHLQT